jgi:hypothetical protein
MMTGAFGLSSKRRDFQQTGNFRTYRILFACIPQVVRLVRPPLSIADPKKTNLSREMILRLNSQLRASKLTNVALLWSIQRCFFVFLSLGGKFHRTFLAGKFIARKKDSQVLVLLPFIHCFSEFLAPHKHKSSINKGNYLDS